MCGRFTITVTLEELVVRFSMNRNSFPYYQPKYNVAPSQMIMAIIHDGQANRLGELKWGFLPSWAKDANRGSSLINARAESLHQKPAYRIPLERKRCIIPADSFYEWRKNPTSKGKQPMRIQLTNGGLFGMAGLYDTWQMPDGGKLNTCAIITTESNSLLAPIHERMPAILRPEDEATWLNRSNHDSMKLLSLLKPYPTDEMKVYRVSESVGNVSNDSVKCIEEVEDDLHLI